MSKTILEYIGLDLENLPETMKFIKPKYDTAKAIDNATSYKVYKRIPVKSIEILISDTDRTTNIMERYQQSITLDEFISENKKSFEKMANNTKIEDVEKLEELQDSFQKQIPYFVKYDKNYLWQIYYSRFEDKYFMLFPTKEGETEVLFYMIKQKLLKEDKYIYVPICKEECSEEIISSSKLKDIENYIWMFTGVWPNIFEVTTEKKSSLFITGQVRLQQDFSSRFRIELKNSEDAETQYTILKALFVISTETKNIYKFVPQVNTKGELVLGYDKTILKVDNLKDFITKETAKQQNLKYEYKKLIDENKEKLNNINTIVNKQVEIYNRQEKQISAFMSYRKSFFGRVKLFFTNNKKMSVNNKKLIEKLQKDVKKAEESEVEQVVNDADISDVKLNLFTISDLVTTSLETKKVEDENNNLIADINAAKIKQKNMKHKIENAQIYLDEIEEHKKSLLEFWKFTNKDNQDMLNKGQEEVQTEKKQIAFSLDNGFEEFAEEIDRFQRQKLSKDECDAIYVAKYLLPGVNSVVTRSDTFRLDEEYDELMKEYESKAPESSIFGNLLDDQTKVKNINNKKHRENHKELYSILRFNELTTLDDFKERMREIGILVNEAYQKLTTKYDMTIYYSKRNKGYIMGNIDPYILIKDSEVKKIYKMQTSSDTHLIYFSNIVFYDNNNKTLPLGMDESSEFITKVGENKKISDVDINLLIEKDLFNVEVRKIKIIEEGKRN